MGPNLRDTHSEIVILGGGLVGTAAALALARLGHGVLLLNAGKRQRRQSASKKWDDRIYAITPGNATWLETLGVWQKLDGERVCAVDTMEIRSDDGSPLCFDAYAAHLQNLSFIIENSNLQNALNDALEANEIARFDDVVVLRMQQMRGKTELYLNDGRVITTDLLVAADGANSWARGQLGITVNAKSYQQTAVVANFALENTHHNTAWQWFMPDGVLAFLPLPDKKVSIVWSANAPEAAYLLGLGPVDFVRKVTGASGAVFGKMRLLNTPLGFPLKLQMADEIVKPGVVLVGDAAHLVHPLAGQGVNLGFRDVVTLAETLASKRALEPLGDYMLLRRYARARQADVMAIKHVTDGLHRLFNDVRHPLLQRLRNGGMAWVNKQGRIKNLLIKRAII